MVQPEQLDELRDRARGTLEILKAGARERPLFVEFTGTPKSGKSSCIDIVAHFFRRVGFNVLAPTEGASKRTPYYLKRDLTAFNTWSACYALEHVLEGLHHSDPYHIAILDRGLFDALVWFELLESKGEVSSQDRKTVQDFLLIHKWRSVIDLLFLFTADPTTSLERENRDKLIDEPGTAMNPEFLAQLNSAYEAVRERHGPLFPNLVEIDTSGRLETTPQSTAFDVTQRILERLPRP